MIYTKELVEIMKSYLDSKHIDYAFDAKQGAFTYKTVADAPIGTVYYHIKVMLHSYSISSAPADIKINASDFNAVADYLNRMNDVIPYAYAYVQDELLFCTHRLNCKGIVPTNDFIDNCFEKLSSAMNVYGKGANAITDGKGSAQEIFETYKSEVQL